MATSANHPLRTKALAAAGGLGGLVISVIVVLNLHILAGLENGYAASPREVWDGSAVLAVVDVVLLVAGPILGALAVNRMLPRRAP